MEMPFINGVPYLSRDEERDAVALENARMNKLSIADIHLAADEVESRTFVMRVRQEITEWVENKSVRGRKLQAVFSLPNLPVQKHPSEYLNISADANAHAILHGNERGLNNFQKRLVHQLVRAEFPSFVSISRGTFIQLVAYDKPREDALKKTRMKSYLDKVSRQIGLRWFFEGLAGGDISSLDPLSMLKPNPDKKPKWIDVEKENKEFNEIQELIKKRPPVLVGHNIFTDLVNLYRCFFGPLPDTVEEFQRAIHDLFPLVIDTKYLATHGNPSPNAKSGLEELDKDLGTMPVPLIGTFRLALIYSLQLLTIASRGT
jgi:poly(A)-specific ribonuclease